MARPTQPDLPTTPDALLTWRRGLGVTRCRLAQELGIGERSLAGYEAGNRPIPPLLPWALVGVFRPLRSKLRLEAKRRRANEVRRKRRKAARKREEQLQAARERERERRQAVHAELDVWERIVNRPGRVSQADRDRIEKLARLSA